MRNLAYSIGAVAALAVIMFSSAGTRPALAASRAEDRAAWSSETAVLISDSPDVLGGTSDNVLVDAAAEAEAAAEVDAAADAEAAAAADAEANAEADAEANAAAEKIDKTMKLRLFPQGGKHGVYAL